MKIPLCLLLALASAAFAVERPAGFIGIPWGASPEEAKRILQKRTGVKFPEESDDFHIELTGGTFAGQPVAKWVIEFPDRKFASGAVTLQPEGSPSSAYKEFRSQLTAKYGSPTTDKKLTAGKASAVYSPTRPVSFGNATSWRFPVTMKEKSVIVISAELAGPGGKAAAEESQLSLTLKYVNETLTGAAAAAAANPSASAKPTPAPVKKDDL